MASLMELVEKINKGEYLDPVLLETYLDSANTAEKFLANHARAMLDLRRSQSYLLEALEAIDYADQKVLFQYMSVLGFLGVAEQRTRPVVRFAGAAISRREVSLAMEAIQSAVTQDEQLGGHFLLDRDNASMVARQYQRAAESIGFYSAAAPASDNTNQLLRIGYLTSSIIDDQAPARLIGMLNKHLDTKDVRLHVYSTEAAVRREKLSFNQGPFSSASTKRGKETLDQLTRRKSPVWMAPLEGDFADNARDLATQIGKDNIDVLLIDAAATDPIAAVVAHWPLARAQLHLTRHTPLLSGKPNAAVYVDAHVLLRDELTCKQQHVPTVLITPGVEPVGDAPGVLQRSVFGIPDQSVIIATIAHQTETISGGEFVDTIIHLLRQHPNAVLLVAGDAETAPMKRRMDSAGLGKRCGFTGPRRDLPEFLKMADVILTPFPQACATDIVQAMASGRAVVAMGNSAASAHDPAMLLDTSESVATDVLNYAELAGRFIREPALRTHVGQRLRQRATEVYSIQQTVKSIEAICRASLEKPTAAVPFAQAA
jgi:predicted O-linked N-acetylglucosamine transferase (SPINDLY family)